MFRRYTDEGATIAGLTRWLTGQGVPTRTGKTRWDRSVVWAMLRNPASAGTAMFGKTQVAHEPAGLNRVARRQGRSTPRASKTVDRPKAEWIAIPVPAIIPADTFERAATHLVRMHGPDSAGYRERHGLAVTNPLTAPETSDRYRQRMAGH
jgi:site-specific DNA recombinase